MNLKISTHHCSSLSYSTHSFFYLVFISARFVKVEKNNLGAINKGRLLKGVGSTLAGTPSEKLERKIEIFRIIKLP